MRPILILLIFLLSLTQKITATEAENNCVNGDSDSLFFKTGYLPSDDDCFPEFDYDSNGQQLKSLKWIKIPAGVVRSSKIIGRSNGHNIVDIIYTSKLPSPDNPDAPFVIKVLAYQTKIDVSESLQPFFILSGDNTRWYEQIFESDKEIPFSLHVSVTMPGNGVFWSNYTFVFSKSSVWMSYHSEGGRKVKTKETIYDSTGKVVKTSITDEN